MNIALATAIWLGVALVCAALGGVGGARRGAAQVGMLTACLVMVASVFLIDEALVRLRCWWAIVAILVFGRCLDLIERDSGLGFGGRLVQMFSLFDIRPASRQPPEPGAHRAEARWLVAHAAVLVVGWWLLFRGAPMASGTPALYWSARLLGGIALAYGTMEAIHSALWLVYQACGLEVRHVNARPILSRTLSEFWGTRWNREVSRWLHRAAFLPAARRFGVVAGLVAAFVMSAVLHWWISWVPLDWEAGLTMASFFAVHGALVVLERPLRVRTWGTASQRTWTLVWLLATAPLFTEPMARIFNAGAPLP